MSRQIKFRVWDIDQKRYLSTKEGANYQLYPTYEECVERESGRGIGFRPLGWCIKQPERFIVEQFTSLLDKNGVEIYEGDILSSSFPYRSDIPDNLQIVEWSSSESAFQARDNNSFRLLGRLHPMWWPSHCEIVGNIHQNPELLKP